MPTYRQWICKLVQYFMRFTLFQTAHACMLGFTKLRTFVSERCQNKIYKEFDSYTSTHNYTASLSLSLTPFFPSREGQRKGREGSRSENGYLLTTDYACAVCLPHSTHAQETPTYGALPWVCQCCFCSLLPVQCVCFPNSICVECTWPHCGSDISPDPLTIEPFYFSSASWPRMAEKKAAGEFQRGASSLTKGKGVTYWSLLLSAG